MRLLLLHAREAWYKAVKPALRDPPDPPSEAAFTDLVVAFASVEDGDNVEVAAKAAEEIAGHARRVGVEKALLYPFAHLSSSLAPPREAHRILVEVERRLKQLMGEGNVARAPFGWYKAFRVHCAGHPLCELSRTIKPGSPIYYKGEPPGEAAPPGLLEEKPWGQDTVLALARFQLHPRGRLGDIMTATLNEYIAEALGTFERLPAKPRDRDAGPHLLALVLRACSEMRGKGNAVIDLGDGALYGGSVNARELLAPLMEGFADQLKPIPLGRGGVWIEPQDGPEGEVLAYNTLQGALVPLAVAMGEYQCIGPTDLIAKSLIDHGIRLAREGVTPALPEWLAPVQAAVIPVKDRHVDYAREVLSLLTGEGVRAYLDPPTRGLGARIRAAARLWTPFIIVVGDREVESNTVTVRRRRGAEQETMPVSSALEEILARVRAGPGYRPLPPPPSQ